MCEVLNHHQEEGAPRMARKITPSEQKAQEIAPWLDGQSDVQRGAELLDPQEGRCDMTP